MLQKYIETPNIFYHIKIMQFVYNCFFINDLLVTFEYNLENMPVLLFLFCVKERILEYQKRNETLNNDST